MRLALAFSALAVFAAIVAPSFAAEAPLIPRADFFGNPAKAAGRISPDGHWLSWLAPRNGVLNVWIAPLGALDQARPMTDEHGRPVANYFWAPDSSMLLYATDNGGDENYQLYGVDVTSGARRALTAFPKARVGVQQISHSISGRILITVNNRDPHFFDVASLDLKSGAITPVFRNDAGFGNFIADDGLNLRIADKTLPNGDSAFYRIVGGKAEAQPFETVAYEDAGTTAPQGFTYDGKTLYWVDSRGRDTAAFVAEDVATGRKTVLGSDPKSDVSDFTVSETTGQAQAYATEYLRTDWHPLDPGFAADFKRLQARLKGDVTITSRDHADDKWTISNEVADASPELWLFDRKTKALTLLYSTRPELAGKILSPMLPVEIAARDGLTLPSYLTLPPGSDPGGAGRPSHPIPMVLFVHGGPWARDSYEYSGAVQWLANRGYAVLQVNFRASTGFGKRFTAAGDQQWGKKMQDDLIDAVDWAVKRGVTTHDKVAVVGGSYGGYATLASLAFTPDAFACGVDLFGPVNLNTLLNTTPAYWASMRAVMHRRMGDPGTPEGQAVLEAASPLYAADRIKRPLLIGQGVNDARVKQAESDQMVAAMQAKHVPVTYLLFDDEGHGFQRPENNLAFFAVTEQFLAKCLGGRAEPIGDALKGSTMRVAAGGDLAPGLAAALAAK
jgi:dipeptidyl aminopeptidase/acylaminoacyl peptidase